MAFNPSTTVYLCNVPFDDTYTNQVYFSSIEMQQVYFSGKVVKAFDDYLTVRRTNQSGGLINSIKVNANIDDLYNCNYMYYRNVNHGARVFYAFITQLVYINEGTTEIIFDTDAYQTWLFDVEILDSFVVREHSITDNVGDNVVPEKFAYDDYNYYTYNITSTESAIDVFQNWGYYIVASECLNEVANAIGKKSGVYQGLYFYYFTTASQANIFLEKLQAEKDDCIVSISVVPEFSINNATIIDPYGDTTTHTESGVILNTDKPNECTFDISGIGFTNPDSAYISGMYSPTNNKLLTNPFHNFYITNNQGDEAIYNFEDFDDKNAMIFKMYGDISCNPSLTLFPIDYKQTSKATQFGISINNFPQCAYNTDTFKLWLAKNQFSIGSDIATGLFNVGAGVATMATGAGAGVGAMQVGNGISQILNSANSVYQASRMPNQAHTGAPKNNLLTAIGKNRFNFAVRQLKPHLMKVIDDFFTMYGYATNTVKKPNVSSRPYFNYVQTINVNIKGAIPCDDMKRLKMMYNNGVTLWKPIATIGDYSVNNKPVTNEG